MKLQHVFGSVVAAAAFVSVPTMLSAQNGQGNAATDVRITLLPSGEIQVSGDFILEASDPDVTITGRSMAINRNTSVIDFNDGISVESSGFVVDADAGSLILDASGQAVSVHLRDSRITRTQ